MKVYVAGKAGATTVLGARAVIDAVIEAGHEAALDWTVFGNRAELGPRRAKALAQDMIRAVTTADVLVLARGQLPPSGTRCEDPPNEPLSAYVEVGVALAADKPVFVLPGRLSIFWHLDNVQTVNNVPGLLRLLDELEAARR